MVNMLQVFVTREAEPKKNVIECQFYQKAILRSSLALLTKIRWKTLRQQKPRRPIYLEK